MKTLNLRNTALKVKAAAAITVMALALMSFDLPFGWFKAGSSPDSYEMTIEKGAGQDGKNAATIRSTESNINGFGTLMQTSSASDYLGKRIRMSGYMKTNDLSNWAGFWLRVDQKGSDRPLAFDNMHDGKTDRSVTGSTGWTKYEIVLDVPQNAYQIAYGALEVGTGQIWIDNMAFEVVDNSVETTGSESRETNTEPVNLDFEQSTGTVSEMGNMTSDFTIKNNLNVPVSLYWVDFSGREIFYFDLNPGQETIQKTYLGHVWRAHEKNSNKELKEIKVETSPESWVIN